MQAQLDFSRAAGEAAAQACLAKAERVSDFDAVGAAKFIVSQLVRHGKMSGEALTDAAIAHGFRPHDARAYGHVFRRLLNDKRIRYAGPCARTKGHGSRGGAYYEVAA